MIFDEETRPSLNESVKQAALRFFAADLHAVAPCSAFVGVECISSFHHLDHVFVTFVQLTVVSALR